MKYFIKIGVEYSIETDQILKKIYQDLKDKVLKNDNEIFVKEYEIPSYNYSKDRGIGLWWASGIEMEINRMMQQFDNKIFFTSYKDKYFFSNSKKEVNKKLKEELDREKFLKEISKPIRSRRTKHER